jgi:hypothetical protein
MKYSIATLENEMVFARDKPYDPTQPPPMGQAGRKKEKVGVIDGRSEAAIPSAPSGTISYIQCSSQRSAESSPGRFRQAGA